VARPPHRDLPRHPLRIRVSLSSGGYAVKRLQQLLVVVGLLIFVPPAHAQDRPEALSPLRFDSVTLDQSYKRARRRRNLGIALAVPGVTVTLLGILLCSYASTEEPNTFAEIDENVAGAIIAVAGSALAIPGIYFWMTGQDDMDVVKWRRTQLAPLISRNGIGFTF
jgi:hypothetical protein